MPTDSLRHLTADTAKAAAATPPVPQSYDLPSDFAEADFGGINTQIIDSIGRDTVSGRVPHFIPVEKADSMRAGIFLDSLSHEMTIPELPSGSSEGVAPIALKPSYFNSTPLTAVLLGTLVLAGINTAGVARALKSYRHDIWSVRRRPNVFDDEHSASAPMAAILVLIFVVFGGIVLYNLPGLPPSPGFAGAGASMALLAIYYIFQYTAYQTVAFAFGSKEQRRQWVNGFMATQAYTGLGLIIPAFLLIYEPEWHNALIIISLILYGIARILFVIKGVRIFYKNFRSLLYFILYLCTLEIIPAFAVYSLSAYLQVFTA